MKKARQIPRLLTLRHRQWTFPLLWVLYLLFLAEICARLFMMGAYAAPFLKPQELIYVFYPELKAAVEADISRKDSDYNVLLLGASVLTPEWGNIEQELRVRIPHPEVRIYNLAAKAHTTLDSYYKYLYLADKRFDLVIVYHGINEVRMNNVPPEDFRSDYSHFAWYKRLNIFQSYKNFPYLALTYGSELAFFEVAMAIGAVEVAPIMASEMPEEHIRAYGREIKTSPIFQNNIQKIIEIARERNEALVLGSFATFLPEDYTLESFLKKESAYGEHKSPVEIWGLPKNVVKGVAEHNRVLRSLTSETAGIIFIDFDRQIPKSGRYFDDICHLTAAGSELFAKLIVEAIHGATSEPN